MPAGDAASQFSGSGASRVHKTKPSGAGEPDATPRLNGSLLQRGAGAARRMEGAAIAAVLVAMKARRVRRREPVEAVMCHPRVAFHAIPTMTL